MDAFAKRGVFEWEVLNAAKSSRCQFFIAFTGRLLLNMRVVVMCFEFQLVRRDQ
jgi:hypothetical protein